MDYKPIDEVKRKQTIEHFRQKNVQDKNDQAFKNEEENEKKEFELKKQLKVKFSINIKKIIKDKDGQFIGRLHIDIEPAVSTVNEEPIFVLTLTARGQPLGEGLTGVMEFMDLGRKCIVKTFQAVTSHSMHNIWGYNNGR